MSLRWSEHVDSSHEGVWRYASLLGAAVAPEHRVELGDVRPIVRALPGALGLDTLFVQREDLNPNGSHKDRSLAVQVSLHRQAGARVVCLSSSGNAAVAAAAACRVGGVRLFAFVSPATPAPKRAALERYGATVVITERAIGLCREFAESTGAPNLRPSTDDAALCGYRALAYAHAERGPEVDSIFVYTTSGSTLLGLSEGFDRLRERGWTGASPALHAAQAGLAGRIAEAFGERADGAERSVIGDLGAKRSRRHGAVVRAIRRSGGHAWALSDAAILDAHAAMLDLGVHLGLESACAVAAAALAGARARVRRPLVLCTGHYGHSPAELARPAGVVLREDTLDALMGALEAAGEPAP